MHCATLSYIKPIYKKHKSKLSIESDQIYYLGVDIELVPNKGSEAKHMVSKIESKNLLVAWISSSLAGRKVLIQATITLYGVGHYALAETIYTTSIQLKLASFGWVAWVLEEA